MATKLINFRVEFTRPNNTTAYAVGDVVGPNPAAALTLTPNQENAVILGQSYLVKSIRLVTNNTTVTNGNFKLYFFKEAPTGIADNSPFTLLYSQNAIRSGNYQLPLVAVEGSGGDCAEAYASDVNIPIKTTANGISAVLVAEGAYTPAGGQTFYISIEAFITAE